MYRLLQFIFRILLYQKHPGKQIIASLICIPIGAIIFYSATTGIVIGDYAYHWPYLMLVGITAALLGVITAIQGIINAVVRGWDGRATRGRTQPKPASAAQPKQVRFVPPKKHNSAAQSRPRSTEQTWSRSTIQTESRRAAQVMFVRIPHAAPCHFGYAHLFKMELASFPPCV